MEPIDIMQETQMTNEETLFQNKPTDQLVMENQQQEHLQHTAELKMQRKESILDQFSKRIPSRSLELERKLQDGPPPELGKFQKIRWTSDMKQKIQDEKKQEKALRERQTRFFAPTDKLVDEMALIKSSLESSLLVSMLTVGQYSLHTATSFCVFEECFPPMTTIRSLFLASSRASVCLREVALHIVSKICKFV